MAAEAAAQTHPGGWTPYGKISSEDRQVFDEATKGLVGVKYLPETVATQVVAGINYRFKCNASMPPAEVVWQAIVEIYKPIKGAPIVTGIIRI